MPDMAARHNENPSGAHPGLEAQLEILPAPDVKAVVVSAETVKELLTDTKQSPSHGGRGD